MIREITQAEADQWLKQLFKNDDHVRQDAKISFHSEKEKLEKGEIVWALPEEERSYFIVSLDNQPVLLVGVNSQCGISSIMKVTAEKKFAGVGRCCLKEFIENKMVKLCKDRGKAAFGVHTATERSWRIFHDFISKPPRGIQTVEQYTAGFVLYLS